ncbi:hypothetical protein [Streptomyces zingiberis]|uniref:Right-handed parallel beta-helix repeat-containing protein n=1 Tax=Streptomyces zingiberis TaxID=2053010 RepID=A0ABX1BXS6_9ACTN|nr:hypothetical protein [Streptomyces zingiberis]NJQ02460.1 hypothetical protein [Streptomyces zingiberis]
MKATLRRGGAGAVLGLGLLLAVLPAPAHSADRAEETAQAEQQIIPCGDEAALRSALVAANTRGSGILTLPSGCVYSFTDDYPDGSGNALPTVTGNIQITSFGATIERSDAATETFRVLDVAAGATLTLNRITVRGGDSTTGGGIRNAGRLILNQSVVTENQATGDGGGIYTTDDLTLNSSRVSDNSAGGNGGGVADIGGDVRTLGGTIRDNTATSDGGGVYVSGSGATLRTTSTAFSGNLAGDQGGGIGVFGTAQARLLGSLVTGNTATSGGGIYEEPGSLVQLTSTPVTGNTPDNCAPAGSVPGCTG